MDALVETSQGDLRMILGQLQMYRLRATSLTYDDVRAAAGKDADMSPFECARKLMSPESAHMTMGDRFEMMFQDSDLIPLLIQVRVPPLFYLVCRMFQHKRVSSSSRCTRPAFILSAFGNNYKLWTPFVLRHVPSCEAVPRRASRP